MATLTAFVKTYACVQLEVTEKKDHNASRKVCIQQGAWFIANKKGLTNHVCHMATLPQVFTLEMSFKSITCRTQLGAAHFSWAMHRSVPQHYATMLA